MTPFDRSTSKQPTEASLVASIRGYQSPQSQEYSDRCILWSICLPSTMEQRFYEIQQPNDESTTETEREVPSLNNRHWRQPKGGDKKPSQIIRNSNSSGRDNSTGILKTGQHESWKRQPKSSNAHSTRLEATEPVKGSESSVPLKNCPSNSVLKGNAEVRTAVNTSFDAVRDEIDDQRLMRRTLLLQDISADTTEDLRREITQPYLSLLHGGGGVLARWLDATTCCIVFSTEALCQRGIDRAARKSALMQPKLLLDVESMQTPEIFRELRDMFNNIPAAQRDVRVANRMITAALGIKMPRTQRPGENKLNSSVGAYSVAGPAENRATSPTQKREQVLSSAKAPIDPTPSVANSSIFKIIPPTEATNDSS